MTPTAPESSRATIDQVNAMLVPRAIARSKTSASPALQEPSGGGTVPRTVAAYALGQSEGDA
jgi:hypothetical protein